MKISVTDEKKTVEDQHRQLEEQIADFQKRKIEYLNKDKDKGYHTLTLGKFGKSKKWFNSPVVLKVPNTAAATDFETNLYHAFFIANKQ